MTQREHPKPTIWHRTMSLLGIAVGLYLLAASISAFAIPGASCATAGGLALGPLGMLLAVLQYRATFCAAPRATHVAAVLSFIVAGLALLGGIGAFVQIASVGAMPPSFVIWLLGAGLAMGVNGWLNLRRSRRLRDASAISRGDKAALRRFSPRDAAAIILGVAITAGIVAYQIHTSPTRLGENVSIDDAPRYLPRQATNISYCIGSQGQIAAEFDIGEAAFTQWVEAGFGTHESNAANVPLREIEGSYKIHRYYLIAHELDGPASVEIGNGLYYDWSVEDRGVYAAYDRGRGRAYIHIHSH